jgi:hypothetical protein
MSISSSVRFLKSFMSSSRELRMDFWWSVVWYTFFVGTTIYYLNIIAGKRQDGEDLQSESCKWIHIFILYTCILGVIRIFCDPIAVFIDISIKLKHEEEEREGGESPLNPIDSLGFWTTLCVMYLYVVRWVTVAWIMSGIWILVYYSLLNCRDGVRLLEFTSIMLICVSVLGFLLATACDFFSWLLGYHQEPTELTQIRTDTYRNYNTDTTQNPANASPPPPSGLDLTQLQENSWCFVVVPAHLVLQIKNTSKEDTDKSPRDTKPEELIKHCSICQEALVVGNKACRLRCGHSFHQNCISCWAAIKPTCPNCCRSILEPN